MLSHSPRRNDASASKDQVTRGSIKKRAIEKWLALIQSANLTELDFKDEDKRLLPWGVQGNIQKTTSEHLLKIKKIGKFPAKAKCHGEMHWRNSTSDYRHWLSYESKECTMVGN